MAEDRNTKGSGRDPGTSRHSWAIDGLEETTASIEHDGDRVFSVPRALIPAGAKEGSVLEVVITRRNDAGRELVTVDVRIDRAATKTATDASARQIKRVPRGNDAGGDITL